MKKIPILLLCFVLCGAIGIYVSRETRSNKFVFTPIIYSQNDITTFLKKRGISLNTVSDLRRNAFGNEIFVYSFENLPNTNFVIKISTNKVTITQAPGIGAILSADGSFAVWGDEMLGGMRFQNGETLRLSKSAGFSVDPGARVFVVSENDKVWLGRIQFPSERVLIADDFLADRIFVGGTNIFITGIGSTNRGSERRELLATCIVVEDNGAAYEVVERLTFDWAAGVVEVDPLGERLLLWDKARVSSSVYEYNLKTMQRHRIGRVKGFQLFLVGDLLD